ncbi:gluconate:H+ symporter [Parvularcula sp. LCG005]|uniref:GntT/GntP/DsdX family permease n=1 Tax=Parvularcula sp. LCG005 TaxID=3078805 RepID=UPI0029434997|nr:gluconate:H+ symporter [Parvularcula sp. LCG005]WOI52415.1 gluconate:H+ symporter [Parvularcula sp. LCG005]
MDLMPLLMTALSIAGLLVAVLVFRLPAFIALLLVCILFGLSTGMAPARIITAIQTGMGGTLGFVAVVVGLGAMMGALLEASGGVEAISNTILRRFGEDKSQWALGLIGFLAAIPVFFDVAFIILIPVLFGLRDKSKKPLIYFAIPLLAGLAVTHAFVPPTPGPIAVAEILKADLGWVILFGALAGLPAMIIAGPLYAKFLARMKTFQTEALATDGRADDSIIRAEHPIGFGSALTVILLPLVLILLSTVTKAVETGGTDINDTLVMVLTFIGHPFVALLIACLYAWIAFGLMRGLPRQKLHDAMLKSLEPAGLVVLVTGAGGVYKQILVESGAGRAVAEALTAGSMSPYLFAFTVAGIVRVAQGSATVAMITAAGLTAPVAQLAGMSGAELGLLVIAISSGASIVSHVNDSGFWLVSRYLGLSEAQTLRSWTVSSTLIGFVGLVVVLILSMFV